MELADARYRDTQSRLITAAVLTGRIHESDRHDGYQHDRLAERAQERPADAFAAIFSAALKNDQGYR